jgi:hypothetical protein
MFVNLRSSDNPSSEIAPTIDISCHGAELRPGRIGSPINSCRFNRSVEISNLLAALPIVSHAWTTAL